jgi:hypothetical protein
MTCDASGTIWLYDGPGGTEPCPGCRKCRPCTNCGGRGYYATGGGKCPRCLATGVGPIPDSEFLARPEDRERARTVPAGDGSQNHGDRAREAREEEDKWLTSGERLEQRTAERDATREELSLAWETLRRYRQALTEIALMAPVGSPALGIARKALDRK